MIIELPVISSCEGCGRCCDRQGSPPFVYLHPSLYRGEMPSGWGEGYDEVERWKTAPEEAISILREYYDGPTDLDRYEQGLPCLWYDGEKKQCRFYNWRPDVCREFEMGGESCRRFMGEDRSGDEFEVFLMSTLDLIEPNRSE
jgi:Fe-S-cluster containining protein